MNVTQGAGTYASSCTPPPKFENQPVIASGPWTVYKSTRKLLPLHPRESERQALLLAAESGRLALRRIKLAKEKDYFSGNGAPRPFSLALPGGMMPNQRMPESYGKWMVGIIDPQCLYVYKRNAGTRFLVLESDLTPETLPIKLLPHLQSLLGKRLERDDQIIWRVYPTLFTSGHLQADGTFSLPKLKSGDGTRTADYPELLLSKYGREDIKCFCVYDDAQINISDILRDKRQCEKVLNLKPLPLVVYCHRTGSVQVCFDDELDSHRLAGNEHSLEGCAFTQGIAPDHFRALLNLLPMSLRADTLSQELNVSPEVMRKLQQAIELVSDPYCYNYEKLLELKQSGLPIHQRFFYGGEVDSLLGLLVFSEMYRNMEPEHEQTQKQAQEACRLLHLLLQSGTKLERAILLIERMNGTSEQVMPAGAMNYMVAAFAPFDFMTLEHLQKIPLIGCPGNVVEFNRICQRLNEEQIQQHLRRVLDVSFEPPPLATVKSHLLALFHFNACLDEKTLDWLKLFLGKYCIRGVQIIDDLTMDDYIEWVEKLWINRKTDPFYQNWPKHVEQSHREIEDLKKSLGLNDSGASATPLVTGVPAALQFVVDAFKRSPILPDNAGDNEKTILTVLQHYYRRPGPERVIQSLGRETMPTVWKPQHSCSHVLRARNNGLWYME
uniref:hypothetical protein n=1 Tax=Endozoicomonas sp. ONNA1 TaxID=2828740 RepID=UPI002148818B